ncbi:MAG: bifunctional [glutamine synthetase] adenylyltransferase/[glutamine synthetase]-adenylyl-L-tyrosine phosphorylase, partial [Pseudomonadota bacterium]
MVSRLYDKLLAALDSGAASSVVGRGAVARKEGGDVPSCPSTVLTEPILDFLSGVASLSPYLGRLMARTPDRLERVLASDTAEGFKVLWPSAVGGEQIEDTKVRLRMAKADIALAIALADLSEVWALNDVVGALSGFADAAVNAALGAAWDNAHLFRGFQPPASGWPDRPCGISLIAMGKMGAGELNYSSDIDLVAIYDPDMFPVSEGSRLDAKAIAVKLVQSTVDILHQQTEHGYVFRTDLRLRPNPGATAVAVSLSASEVYYQVYGQNWERAAYIKARPCAGDAVLGEQFADMMRPFVWRRTLDYGAVADIHAVKQQIHAEKGNPDLAVRGGNIKLGPGGIREIEFF